jgi:hypothetical protein
VLTADQGETRGLQPEGVHSLNTAHAPTTDPFGRSWRSSCPKKIRFKETALADTFSYLASTTSMAATSGEM